MTLPLDEDLFQRVSDLGSTHAAAGRTLNTVGVSALPVLDLRGPPARAQVGLELDDVADDDWTAYQAVGQAAHFLQYGGVLAPSATGDGLVLAVYEGRVSRGQLLLEQSEELSETRYRALSEQ